MAEREIRIIVTSDSSKFRKGLNNAANEVEGFSKKIDAAARGSVARFGEAATKAGHALTLGLTLPLAGVAIGAVKAASNLSESMNAINVVFKEAAGTVADFGETAAESAGLSQRAFNEAIVPIGQLLNNFGFEADASAEAVLALTQRAADLGSTLNVDTSVALEKFQSGLAGEAEPLKAFGVDVSVAAIKQEALALGLIRSGEEMSKNVRAQAALSIIMRETSFAAGDFGNTLEGSLPNQLKQLKADAENAAAALGTALLPSVLDMVKGIQGLVDKFTELSDTQQEFIVKTGLAVGALGPLLFVGGKVATMLNKLRVFILGVNAVLGGGGLVALLKIIGGSGIEAAAALKGVGSAAATAGVHAELLDIALNSTLASTQKQIDKVREVTEAHDSWNAGVIETVEIHDSWNTGLAQTQAGLGEVAAKSSEARLAALELRDANLKAAKSFSDELTEAIVGFVTFFDGAVDEIDTSLKQLETQFEKRRTQNERFWNGLAVLARAGLDDLVAEIQSQGPEAAGVVEDLVADMDRAFEWERRIEESERQAAAMANALANGLTGETDTVGAAFNAFGVSLARQLEAGFSTADLGNTLTQLLDLASPSGVSTPGGSQFKKFHSGGVVPGAPGSEHLIVAQAGETIFPPGSRGSRGGSMGGSMGNSTTIVVQSPMGDFRSDLQYAALIASVTNLVEGF